VSSAQAWRAGLGAQLRLLRALVVGYERPPFRHVGRAVGRTARADDVELGGVPTTVFRPAGARRPWPAVLVVPGVTREGRRHPAFVGVGRGLAAAGVLTAVVDPPGLSVGELTPHTLAETRRAAEALCASPHVRGGRLALAGVSGGGTLALLLAGAPGLAERVSVVAALAPCCDVGAALRLVTTDRYRRGKDLVPFHTGSFFRLVIARSAIAWLEDGPDRRALREHVLGLEDYGAEPLRALRSWPAADLAADVRGVVRLLANVDPERFDELLAGLADEQLEATEQLSPVRAARAVTAPVELVVARNDKYIPLEDAAAFARACPSARTTVIESLEHAVPRVSPAATRDLARLDGVAVRFLAATCSSSYSG
jgi:pimeloyl-ACP methyl ester carboxylesterase